jgi:ABC-type uncharacterized transport system permease subunit
MGPHLLNLAFHAYAVGAAVYLVNLLRPKDGVAWTARGFTALGLGMHGVSLVSSMAGQGGMPLGLAQGFSALAFLLLAIFLFVDVRYRVPVIGAFLTPAALVVLYPGLLMAAKGQPFSSAVQRPLLPLHIAVALLGMAALGLACGVAVLYLVMERQMKGKRFGLLFSRLPSLQFLDELNGRLVVAGFVALSVTVVTGLYFASSSGPFWSWSPVEVATMIAWLVFAGLLNARRFAGWQGRRVALLTLAGFCVLLVSFFSSYDPSRLGGLR